MTPEMQNVIERCYQLFKEHAGLRYLLNVCTYCCVSAEEHRLLVGTPRRVLSAASVRAYNSAAVGYCVDDELEHFLPGLFELAAMDEDASSIFECTFQHLGDRGAQYRLRWDPLKVGMVDAYFLALARQAWRRGYRNGCLAGESMNDILCAIALGGGDLRSILTEWERDTSLEANIQLATLFANLRPPKRYGLSFTLENSFWKDVPQQEQAVVSWLGGAGMAERIDDAMNAETDDTVFAILSHARDISRSFEP